MFGVGKEKSYLNTSSPNEQLPKEITNMTRQILISLLLASLFNITLLNAQVQQFTPDDFEMSGQTVQLGNNCFRLTPQMNWSSGSLWHRHPIDLSHSFEMEIPVKNRPILPRESMVLFVIYSLSVISVFMLTALVY